MDIQVNKLEVLFHGVQVGYLFEFEPSKIGFQYDSQWIQHGFSISPFSLPLKENIFWSNSPHFGGLFGVFNDSLPDGWGELLVRRYLAQNAINFGKLSPLTRLSLINESGLGGLEYKPVQSIIEGKEAVDLDKMALEIKTILNDNSSEINLDWIFSYGGSSGGARPKAHLLINQESWIVKFPSSIDPENMGELEYRANVLARKSGIQVNEFHLFPSTRCTGYFGSKRFDRKDGQRVHMISLSALLETTHRIPNLDYIHLFQVITKICPNKEDLYEAYRRMCFNVLFQNKDDHGKNFSFIYDEQLNGYRLAPAYDITKTPHKFEHEMTVLGKGNPSEEDLLQIGQEFKMSTRKCESILMKIRSTLLNEKRP